MSDKIEIGKKLVAELYEECPTGGYGHIVFDDYNVEDGFVDWCIEQAEKGSYDFISEEGRKLSLAALKHFKTLTEDERLLALGVDPDDAADQDFEFTP